jgi:hypothetical protein
MSKFPQILITDDDCLLEGQSVAVDSQPEFQITNAELSRPVLQNQRLSFVGKPEIVFHVVSLLGLCRPAAICRLIFLSAFIALAAGVMAIGFDSVQRVLVARWLPNVINEGVNGVAPSLAHVVPDCAIEAVVVVVLAVAAIKHLRPNRIDAALGNATSSSISASATASSPVAKILSKSDGRFAAVAIAIPRHPPPAIFRARNNNELTESLSSKVFKKVPPALTLGFSHDATFRNRVALWIEPASVCALRPARFILADVAAAGEAFSLGVAP